jgi:hypothetical protein
MRQPGNFFLLNIPATGVGQMGKVREESNFTAMDRSNLAVFDFSLGKN